MTAEGAGSRLNALLAQAGLPVLEPVLAKRFEDYCSLLMRWNARINLTAIRTEEGILSRHFVESIACENALPGGITRLLDFGSGAGFPGIPIALCRPEMAVTLAESHGRKAAFLQEAVRVLAISAKVHSGRAETLVERFDCVVLRAVDRMPQAVPRNKMHSRQKKRVFLAGTITHGVVPRQQEITPGLKRINDSIDRDITCSRLAPKNHPASDSRILGAAVRPELGVIGIDNDRFRESRR